MISQFTGETPPGVLYCYNATMEAFIIAVAIIQSFSISLGVGASTLALLHFFVSIADGTISPEERRMSGLVYFVLRVAMVTVLISSIIIQGVTFAVSEYIAFNLAQLSVILILFSNAILMTYHLIPSNFGPAIQVASWYVLGLLLALMSAGIIVFPLTVFFLAYSSWIILAISLTNAAMAIQVARRNNLLT